MPKAADPLIEETSSVLDEKDEVELRPYEVMLLWSPVILENKLKEKFKDFEEFIKNGGGKIVTSDIWGKQKLAYRIKSHKEGFYAVYDLVLPTSFVKELNEHLRIDPELIRFIVITLPPDYTYTKYVEEKMEQEMPRRERASKPMNFKYSPSVETKREEEKVQAVEEKKAPAKEVDEVALEKRLDELIEGKDLKL